MAGISNRAEGLAISDALDQEDDSIGDRIECPSTVFSHVVLPEAITDRPGPDYDERRADTDCIALELWR